MTAPNTENNQVLYTIPAAVSMDQMEEMYKVPDPAKPDVSTSTSNDDASFPEQFKGKSVKEIIAHAEALQRAMQISEAGRVAAMRSAQERPIESPPIPQVKEYTREEIVEMMQSDDANVRVQAIDIMNTQAIRKAEAQVTARFGQLVDSSISSAEIEARRMYGKEFELFGDQIADFARQLPDKSQLSNVNGWRNMVSYIRGLDGNIQKYAQAITQAPDSSRNAESARAMESLSTGFSPAPVRNPSPSAKPIVVDDFTREIAKQFGRDPVEYAREIAALG